MHEQGLRNEIKYVQSAWVTTVTDLLVFYSSLLPH